MSGAGRPEGSNSCLLLSSAHKLAFANRHYECINPVIGQCSIEHWPKCLFMIDCVVRNKNTAGHHCGNNGLVTLRIDFLFRIKKAERYARRIGKMIKCVCMNEADDISDTGFLECLPGKFGLFVKNLECGDCPSDEAARQGKPESGIACAGSDLKILPSWSSGRKQGDELTRLRWNLPQSLQA